MFVLKRPWVWRMCCQNTSYIYIYISFKQPNVYKNSASGTYQEYLITCIRLHWNNKVRVTTTVDVVGFCSGESVSFDIWLLFLKLRTGQHIASHILCWTSGEATNSIHLMPLTWVSQQPLLCWGNNKLYPINQLINQSLHAALLQCWC